MLYITRGPNHCRHISTSNRSQQASARPFWPAKFVVKFDWIIYIIGGLFEPGQAAALILATRIGVGQ